MSKYNFLGNIQGNGRKTKIRRFALALILFAITLSLIIAALPSGRASPLVGAHDWSIMGQAFQNVSPKPYEVSDSVHNSPEVVYWRTWSPDTLGTIADISTKPFRPPNFMAIPYGGFAGIGGKHIRLICNKTNEQLTVASAQTNNQITESLIRIPRHWCQGNAVLNATSSDNTKFIVIGTPFSISWIDYYKNSFVGLVGILILTFCCAWGFIFLPNLLFIFDKDNSEKITAGFITFGCLSYALFFVYFYLYQFARYLSAALIISEILCFFWLYVHRKERLLSAWMTWKTPTILWGAVVLSAFSLAMIAHNGAGPWTTNSLFSPVEWSTDNQFPMLIAEHLFQGIDPRTIDLAPWKVSDRPPLAYGMMAILRLISWTITSHNDGYLLFYQYELISGIVINGLWIVALYYLLFSLKLDRRNICLATLIVGLTSFSIFNSIYIWPKMLGGAYGVLAFVELFEPEKFDVRLGHSKFGNSLLIAAGLSCLALLSHGGTMFGIIASILVALRYRGLPSIGLTMGTALIGLALLAPWSLWQHFEQPPGNALIKYLLAGNFGFGEQYKSVSATVHDAYAVLSPWSWLRMKLHALRVLTLGETWHCGTMEPIQGCSIYGRLRTYDYRLFGQSLRFLVVGFVPFFLMGRVYVKGEHPLSLRHFIRLLVGTGLLSIGIHLIIGFNSDFNHMQSYQSILEVLVGLALALHCSKRWYFDLALKLSMLYALVVWILDPLASAPDLALLPVLMLCAIAITCYGWFTSPQFKNTASQP